MGRGLSPRSHVNMALSLIINRPDQSYVTHFLGFGLFRAEYIIMAVFAGVSSWMQTAVYVLISVTKSSLLECEYIVFGF